MLSKETESLMLDVVIGSTGRLSKLDPEEEGLEVLIKILHEYFTVAKLVLHVIEREASSQQMREASSSGLMNVDLAEITLINELKELGENADKCA